MDILAQDFGLEGLSMLIGAAFLAGLVRGFSGFGTAMIFMPIAALVVEPTWAIMMMIAFDFFGPLLLLPGAWRDAEISNISLLMVGTILTLPFGVHFLTQIQPNIFRWLISCLTLIMLILLVSGWRYRNPLGWRATIGVGGVSGFLCGMVALAGPPVILSYLSSARTAVTVRSNSMIYLFLADIMVFGVFALKGLLLSLPLLIGVILTVPYGIAAILGAWIFCPQKQHIYRGVAYVIIAASALAGLPIWS